MADQARSPSQYCPREDLPRCRALVEHWPGLRSEIAAAWERLCLACEPASRVVCTTRHALAEIWGEPGRPLTESTVSRRLARLDAIGLARVGRAAGGLVVIELVDPVLVDRRPLGTAAKVTLGVVGDPQRQLPFDQSADEPPAQLRVVSIEELSPDEGAQTQAVMARQTQPLALMAPQTQAVMAAQTQPLALSASPLNTPMGKGCAPNNQRPKDVLDVIQSSTSDEGADADANYEPISWEGVPAEERHAVLERCEAVAEPLRRALGDRPLPPRDADLVFKVAILCHRKRLPESIVETALHGAGHGRRPMGYFHWRLALLSRERGLNFNRLLASVRTPSPKARSP